MTALLCLLLGLTGGLFLGGFIVGMRNRETPADPDAPTTWTVVAIWPASKERYLLHVQATGPREAEDLVEWEAKHNHGGQPIWVAAVFEGRLDNADKYATFEDPDVKPTDWNPLT